jgi:hypothetical protein
MNSVLLVTFTLTLTFTTGSFASDDALSRLRAAAARDRQKLDEISAKIGPTAQDLLMISKFIHERVNPLVEIPSNELVPGARLAFAKIATQHPSVFIEFIRENLVSLREYPYQVADLILMALQGAPQVLNVLTEENLIGHEAVGLVLRRETGFNPIQTGFAGTGRVNLHISSRILAAQLPDKIEVAIALFDVGARDEQITEIFIEALELKSLPTKIKMGVMVRLGNSGTTNQRAVAALKSVVMPPITIIGGAGDMNNFRLTAVSAIGAISTQASVDALWEIAGLDRSIAANSRPLPDTEAVIALAKKLRLEIMSRGQFQNRGIIERVRRRLRDGCFLLLHSSDRKR